MREAEESTAATPRLNPTRPTEVCGSEQRPYERELAQKNLELQARVEALERREAQHALALRRMQGQVDELRAAALPGSKRLENARSSSSRTSSRTSS